MSEFDRQSWLASARALLDESTSSLDGATLSRLNRARQAALGQRRRRFVPTGWLPAAGLLTACALVVAVALWTPLQRHGSSPSGPLPAAAATQASAGSDADAADDSVEFYQNLEFYAWLDAEQDSDG